MEDKALYIHIPFCMQKCLYCDFTSFANIEYLQDSYVDALCKELIFYKDYIISTVYIGGGTPTFLNVKNLKKIGEVLKKMNLSNEIEFSVEGNPGTFTLEKLKVLKDMGVNRLSIGLQSYDDRLLKKLGRIHNVKEFEESYNLARNIGFNNINIDLMFALPTQNLEMWKDTLKNVVKLSPEHLSCYSLIIEEGTPFYKMYKGKELLPEEDEERAMYNYTLEFLKQNNYEHYEISNFCKKDRRCNHNLAYWNLNEYIGCGVSAHGFLNLYRIENVKSIKKYIDMINNNDMPIVSKHKNNKKETIEEFMFMGLRKMEGINKNIFNKKFNISIENLYYEIIEKYKKLQLLEENKENLRLTKRGIEVYNVILADFLL